MWPNLKWQAWNLRKVEQLDPTTNLLKYSLNPLMNHLTRISSLKGWGAFSESSMKLVLYSETDKGSVCYNLWYLWVNLSTTLSTRKWAVNNQEVSLHVNKGDLIFSFHVTTYPTRNMPHTPTKKYVNFTSLIFEHLNFLYNFSRPSMNH